MDNKIKNSILASFIADAYSLGAHWIYDEKELQSLPINWEALNKPQVKWHKGKEKGDFTHYGDQLLFLLEYINENKSFNKMKYYSFWSNKMTNYQGYIDSSSKNTLTKIGFNSSDLSICGRISPLLMTSKTKDIFLSQVKAFVEISHNSELSIEVSLFFAELLWDTKENQNLRKNIQSLKEKYNNLEKWINEGVSSSSNDTTKSLTQFGTACNIDSGFLGVIHLLSLDNDFKTIMIKNAKAGGDNSSRAMIVAMLLGVDKKFLLPSDWANEMNKVGSIKKLLGS